MEEERKFTNISEEGSSKSQLDDDLPTMKMDVREDQSLISTTKNPMSSFLAALQQPTSLQGQIFGKAAAKSSSSLLSNTTNFFSERRIDDLFNFMVQHLLIALPEEPIAFLKDLMDRCLLWRSGTVKDAPHIFEKKHVEALFRDMDPSNSGFIHMSQYNAGFEKLGLKNFNHSPESEGGNISKEVFVNEALTSLEANLKSLLKPPYKHLCELTNPVEEKAPGMSAKMIKKIKKKKDDNSSDSLDSIDMGRDTQSSISFYEFHQEEEDDTMSIFSIFSKHVQNSKIDDDNNVENDEDKNIDNYNDMKGSVRINPN